MSTICEMLLTVATGLGIILTVVGGVVSVCSVFIIACELIALRIMFGRRWK